MTSTVCVTGAAGFIGSHVVRELLERGHTVRATVRNKDDAAKVEHLRDLARDAKGTLELYSADLLVPGSFDEPVAGSTAVIHVASSVTLTAKDPQREIVDVAVEGTKNVLAAIDKTDTVTYIGLTSSVAAVLPSVGKQRERTYTEDDWNDDATVDNNPYGLSKAASERLVWAHHDGRPTEGRYRLVVVNPALVVGPVYSKAHLRSSPSAIKDFLVGTFPAVPPLSFGLVDVRDVASVLADGLDGRAETGRYLMSAKTMWMVDIAKIVATAFPDRKVTTRKLWGPLLYAAALFDKRLSWTFLRRNLGCFESFDSSKVEAAFGELRRPSESIVDTCNSMIELGFVKAA